MRRQIFNSSSFWFQWPVYFVWFGLVVYLGWPMWPDPLTAGPVGQDDALHLVQVRDLLAGQNWFDLVQHRLQPPAGLEMHWSRLIDAPMAVLSALLGERAMLFVWPGALIGGFLFAALYFARRLDQHIELSAVLLVSAASLVPLSYFAPGRIDHHNVQMILGLVFAGALLQPLTTFKPALIAACSAAIMMAIGLETIPYVALGLVVIGISWAFGFSSSSAVGAFGLSFAVLVPLVWVVQTGVQTQMPVCDMLSFAYVLPTIAGGTGLALSGYFGKNAGALGRLCLLLATAALALFAMGLANTDCFAGPMAQVPAELQERWLKTVAEAQPLSAIVAAVPKMALERYGPPLLATLIGSWLLWRKPDFRYPLIVCLAFLLTACLITVVQLRGTLFAHIFSIAIFAFAIDLARKHYVQNQKSGKAIAIMAIAVLTCQSFFFVFAASFLPERSHLNPPSATPDSNSPEALNLTEIERECAEPKVRSQIAKLGKALVAAPVFYSTQILEMSKASVIAGPYHRATDAIFDTLRLFEDGRASEAEIMARWKPTFVLLCLTSADTLDTIEKYPGSLSARLVQGEIPDWLTALPRVGQLGIFSVNPRS